MKKELKPARRHVSFKQTIQDQRLLEYLDSKSEVYGTSTFIKILLQESMYKESRKIKKKL